ncbi:ATP-binding protein [Caldithrix abyssi]
MKSFFNSFYVRLSAVFLILLVILGGLQIGFTLQTWNKYHKEADQRLNLNLASDMARELEPLLKDSSDIANIGHTIHYMMVLNPKIEIYLLDEQGKILAFFADPQKKVKARYVSLEPIQQFLSSAYHSPILGEDPRHPGVMKPFSAAPLKIGKNINGFLYIILGGELYDSAINTIRESYLTQTIIKGLVVTLVFTALIGLLLFFFLTKRLHQMNEVVKSFENGQLDQRIKTSARDELGQLAQSFNRMAEKIVANIEELKNTDRLRRELIANISHDLRTPLASIRGYLETIQMKSKHLTNEEHGEYLRIISETAEGMQGLVEQLFELSKLEARQIKPHFEPFSIKELIYDVVMKFQHAAEKKRIAIKISVPDGLPQVYADLRLMERALTNLVENAVNYTPPGGAVIICASRQNKEVLIEIMDTGRGIAAEELPLVFERFFRGRKVHGENANGSGLGLAITKKIIELHQSNIAVESKLNQGSKFYFGLQVWQEN